MAHSNHGIVKDEKGQEQPADKERARTAQTTAAHKTNIRKPKTREATRDPDLNEADKTPGSGMTSDDRGDPPTG